MFIFYRRVKGDFAAICMDLFLTSTPFNHAWHVVKLKKIFFMSKNKITVWCVQLVCQSWRGLTSCRWPQVWRWQRASAGSECGSPSTRRWGNRSPTPPDIAPSETGRTSYPPRWAVASAKYRWTECGTRPSQRKKRELSVPTRII